MMAHSDAMKTVGALLAALALVSGAACQSEQDIPDELGTELSAQTDVYDFSERAGDDLAMSPAEFDDALGALEIHRAWDLNDDGELAKNEFVSLVMHSWDVDNDALVSELEHAGQHARWYDDTKPSGSFELWDRDESGELDLREVATAVSQTGLFEAWDADGDFLISEAEFADEAFAVFDVDGDRSIDADEWADVIEPWARGPSVGAVADGGGFAG